mmetsp:Transcript_20423/g.43561  ORF Transcript_20423/g.43561 Transcript_20423/m.43561 type:complete len:180 (-) Transcript_20423:51-590(-)
MPRGALAASFADASVDAGKLVDELIAGMDPGLQGIFKSNTKLTQEVTDRLTDELKSDPTDGHTAEIRKELLDEVKGMNLEIQKHPESLAEIKDALKEGLTDEAQDMLASLADQGNAAEEVPLQAPGAEVATASIPLPALIFASLPASLRCSFEPASMLSPPGAPHGAAGTKKEAARHFL